MSELPSAPAAEQERDRRNGAFRRRVLAGTPVFGTFLQMGSPVSAEVCGRAGFDWGLIDLEHGLGAEASLLAELMALELAGASAIVRVETGSPLRISRALDQGAAGLMVPRVRSAAEAAVAVQCVRYPPEGARGVALSVRAAGFGSTPHDGLGMVNAGITTMIQIENAPALADVACIAAVDGVDVLFVGPNDLTHSLGIPGRFEAPVYRDALAEVSRAAGAAGKACGILLRSPAELEAHRALGYSVFVLLSDSSLLAQSARSALSLMRGNAPA
jgi:2-dehydro-3-deoxyglucarate aldolase/4-hydroxy-2-oxoheptanedioate aldolase